jgi:hypothetical protein
LSRAAAELQGAELRGKSAFAEVLRRSALELPGRCLFIVLSDLFVPLDDLRAGLKFLHFHGHDALVLQTLDRDEVEFPFPSNLLFRGLEDSREVLTEPRRVRQKYLEVVQGFLREVRRACESCAFDYQLLDSTSSLSGALASVLAARVRRRRTARRGRGA